MTFGWCYDDAGTKCSSGPTPGAIALRDTLHEFLGTKDYGIFNCRPKRTGNSLSLHAVGRAVDEVPVPLSQGDAIAQFLVDAAQVLGAQRVIWGRGPNNAPKEWDSRNGERFWEPYSGPAHDDHCHVEICKAAGAGLTRAIVIEALRTFWRGKLVKPLPGDEEDDLPYTEAQLTKIIADAIAPLAAETAALGRLVEKLEIRTRLNYVKDGVTVETLGTDVKALHDALPDG